MAIDPSVYGQVQQSNPLNALASGYQLGNTIRQQPMVDQMNQQKLDAGKLELDNSKLKQFEAIQGMAKTSLQADYYGAVQIAPYLASGDMESVKRTINQRKEAKKLIGMPTDTEDNFLAELQSNPEQAKKSLEGMLSIGERLFGKSQSSRPVALNPGGQLYGPDGTLWAENNNVRQSAQQQQTPSSVAEWQFYSNLPPDQRAQYDAMKRGTPGYSSTTEKQIYGASDAYVDDNAAFENYTDLAKRYEQAQGKLASGVQGSVSEWLKEQTGNQDELTLLRKDWSKIKASELVNNLPPGAASDADIMLAKEGFLPTNADPKTVASFLRGVAKLRKLNAEYNAFKADYLSENKNPGGLRKAWQERASQIGVGGPTNSSSQFTSSTGIQFTVDE